MARFFNSQSPEVQSALIAAMVSLFTVIITLVTTFILTPLGAYLIGKRQLRHRLRTEYEYEQRKRLADTINRYRGLTLNTGDILKTRLFNLYANQEKGWLRVNEENYQNPGYYFTTTVYRFLAVTTSVQQFESEALYIDPRIAETEDFDFVYGLKLLQKAATDVSLFKGMNYDTSESRDHFFSDTLRMIADSCWKEERFLTFEEFRSLMGKDRDLDPALEFFNDLKAGEERFRWDRLVVFHLFLIAFINTFGYEFQRTGKEEIARIAEKIEHTGVCKNLIEWLREYRLFGQSRYGQNLRTMSSILEKKLERREKR